ncbi:MAG: hypothetical protein AAGF22_12745, partial [Pseudomonadota bacterium]
MAEGTSICECCGGITVSTPAATYARAGLGAVEMRAGSYWSFRDTMTARLTSAEYGTLADLKTRDATVDFSIALIDAWAVTLDILTFYAERLSTETLLDTAQEVPSLHLLARLVGYRPHPGVSASAELTFTLSEAPGAPRAITLPSGVKVQSTPGPDEDPVIFETSNAIPARPAWNAMRPLLGAPQELFADTSELVLPGVQNGLTAGDALYFEADDGTDVLAMVREVRLAPANPAEDPDAGDLT